MNLLQIVPNFAPQVCGVGDYARVLGDRLEGDHGLLPLYAVASPLWKHISGSQSTKVLPIQRSGHLDPASPFGTALATCAGVLVHYVGYGYAKRGTPLWLLRLVRKCKAHHPRLPVHLMVHEVAALGPWRSSSFWLRPVQKHIVNNLARLASGGVYTNREDFARLLREWTGDPGMKITVLPIASNLGEAPRKWTSIPPHRTLAFFGWEMPDHLIPLFQSRLRLAIEVLDVKKLVVFRHPLKDFCMDGVEVETHGNLPAEQISVLLQACQCAYLDYDPMYLGKSSLLGAYAAHGLVTLIHSASGVLPDGIVTGHHVLSLEDDLTSLTPEHLASIANNLQSWYAHHDRQATATTFGSAILEAWRRNTEIPD